jgi:hypothetical protein
MHNNKYIHLLMVFNATFKKISVIFGSFIGGGNWSTKENHQPAASH